MNPIKKRFFPLVLACVLSLSLGTGCSRHDPADDVVLYWPEEMSSSELAAPSSDDSPLIVAHDAPKSYSENIKEFKTKNSDAVGWLYFPDTTIDEVVVQDEDDNTTYHRANALGQYDFNGCLYADYECRVSGDANQISPNIVIYGHSMTDTPDGPNDEKKFTQLKKLLDKDFAETHPYIYFSNGTQDFVYEIFSVMYANTDDFLYNDCNFSYTSDPRYLTIDEFINEAKANSIFNYPATPTSTDKFLTLSTCTYKWGEGETNTKQRYIVFGRLLTQADDMPQSITLTENELAKMPVFD